MIILKAADMQSESSQTVPIPLEDTHLLSRCGGILLYKSGSLSGARPIPAARAGILQLYGSPTPIALFPREDNCLRMTPGLLREASAIGYPHRNRVSPDS